MLVLLGAADVGLVHLNLFTEAADRRRIGLVHRFAQAMADEPSCLVRNAERAADLVGADALLARRHQKRCQQPLVKRHLGALKDGPDSDGELLATGVALVAAGA